MFLCYSNKIEDENYFLLDCKAYSKIRDVFFSKIVELKYLTSVTSVTFTRYFNSSSYEGSSSDYLLIINCQLVLSISQCFELRHNLISVNE